jgi:hypothetical protein
MRTSTVEPTAHGSIPAKKKMHLIENKAFIGKHHCTVVYHDARMKYFFSHFFTNTGHFEHKIRHDIKIFEKTYYKRI